MVPAPGSAARRQAAGAWQALGVLAAALLSRLLGTPLTWLVPRDPGLWIVLGREHGRYLDNAKHCHAWLAANLPAGHRVLFAADSPRTATAIRRAGGEAFVIRGLPVLRLLRAGTLVCDNADYVERGRVGLLRGARVVQLWHGAPLKEIELPLFAKRLRAAPAWLAPLLRMHRAILGRHRAVDVLVSTSAFMTAHAFRASIPAHRIVACGYPRNDALFGSPEGMPSLLAVNTDAAARARMAAHRAAGGKVVLWAPTFRGNLGSPLADSGVDVGELQAFARRRNVLFVLKLHPVLAGRHGIPAGDGILEVDAASDIYPLLAQVDVLVTDYSSIYFDFLLLDRPLLFFAWDLAAYVAEDRRLLFDYATMTPGQRVATFDALLEALADTLADGGDAYRADRARVRALAFDHADGLAGRRLWQALAGGPETPP